MVCARNRVLMMAFLLVSSFSSRANAGISTEAIEKHLDLRIAQADTAPLASVLISYSTGMDQKAIAAASNREGRVLTGVSVGATTRGEAARQALTACEDSRRPLSAALQQPCELILVNDEWVSTQRELTEGITRSSAASVWHVRGEHGLVYLAGSVHVLRPSFYPLPHAFEQAFSHADRLALELNPILTAQPDRMAIMQAAIVASPDNVSLALGDALRSRLASFLRPLGIPVEAALAYKPAVLSTQLSMQVMQAYGYTSDFGVDLHFAQRATRQGMPIIELETVAGQMQTLVGAPLDVQAKLLEKTLDQLADSQATVNDLVRTWLSGDAERMHTLMVADFKGSPALEKLGRRLLDERNVEMVGRIQVFLREPSTTFVIVGAGHFGGDQGILELLRTAGYDIEQLAQDGSIIPDRQTRALPARGDRS